MKVKPVCKRIGLGVAGLLLLAAFLYIGPSSTQEKSDWALRILATALSILAGILLAVITMVGDPRSLYPGNWRVASIQRREICSALDRFVMLFWLYLFVIVLALAAALLEAFELSVLGNRCVEWVKHVALGVGSLALLWSFPLPGIIRDAQVAKLDHEVEERKRHGRLHLDAHVDETKDL